MKPPRRAGKVRPVHDKPRRYAVIGMKLTLAAAMMGAERLEGLYACQGKHLTLHSRFGSGTCRLGGIPAETLAEMMLRDQARIAAIRARDGEDTY